ncbi:VOC family protein [Candidatus Methylacidithermus pantelleriae]|uniref:VOC family protein n=1 Tax=Candidatus Methylacidithermus pantelleriae TaxID=2744239 RepID=A0A8J2BJ15_9BACT|nr:VOC family protein [Candidatus Methylacidithermus pantelleriae]CAF0698935.1 VOC family protein [Candidatus Methylacidithermus pantelleriae]
MPVDVFGYRHFLIEADDIQRAVTFYQDVFGLHLLLALERRAFFWLEKDKLIEFCSIVPEKYGLARGAGFPCLSFDPFGNRIQVVTVEEARLALWIVP